MQMQNTRVKDLMETTVIQVGPEDSLFDASAIMKKTNCGCLIVGFGDKIEGMITDRDIVVRAVAESPDLTHKLVRTHMTGEIHACHEDDTIGAAVKMMHAHCIGRLLVTNGAGKTCGILSFGKILRNLTDDDEIRDVIAAANGKTSALLEGAMSGNARHTY